MTAPARDQSPPTHPWTPKYPGRTSGPCRDCIYGPLASHHIEANPGRTVQDLLARQKRARSAIVQSIVNLRMNRPHEPGDVLRPPGYATGFDAGLNVGALALELIDSLLAGVIDPPPVDVEQQR